jgi:catalase
VAEPRAVEFVGEAYKHCKTIGATGEGATLLEAAGIGRGKAQPGQKEAWAGVVLRKGGDINGVAAEFIKAVAQHRHWSRERKE